MSLWQPQVGPAVGIPYVVFAGNVGDTDSLSRVVRTLVAEGESVPLKIRVPPRWTCTVWLVSGEPPSAPWVHVTAAERLPAVARTFVAAEGAVAAGAVAVPGST